MGTKPRQIFTFSNSMFKSGTTNDERSSSEAQTIIGPSVHLEGDLKAVGSVQIEGSVSGTVTTDKDLFVGGEAKISANVKAQNATIAGEVKGKIDLTGKLTLKPTAKIEGDVNTGSLSIENGAKLNGQVHMGQPAAQQKPSDHQQKH